MRKMLHIIATCLPALAGWAGLAIYFAYKHELPIFSFRIWHAVLVLFCFSLVSLVYYKFFDYFSLWVVIIAFLVVVLIADVIAFSLSPQYLTNFTSLDFILSYALMVAAVSTTHIIYHKSWRKNNT